MIENHSNYISINKVISKILIELYIIKTVKLLIT